ncbi:DUF2530 domain-containing protein [Microbacterium sp. STN6]|uniref:DUF2530 domain-containing protein n=1 Tax=Microbacterium sp. STN6 TaxID=2995588 RepID=UPI0022609794|nr:DUF2530 domain-containing protein [Microbacterium sp. STN6]MCX7523412.1 DUF2530 domain-containing protein [Microbacterium sp. STN6]
MRIWLRDSERRPDPEPVQTDDRKAVIVGLCLWLLGLVALLIFGGGLYGHDRLWWVTSDLVGIALGVIGLVYLSVKRR